MEVFLKHAIQVSSEHFSFFVFSFFFFRACLYGISNNLCNSLNVIKLWMKKSFYLAHFSPLAEQNIFSEHELHIRRTAIYSSPTLGLTLWSNNRVNDLPIWGGC